MSRKVNAPYFIPDEMPETRHPKSGKIFTSKAKFRAETRRFGLEECYGEPDSSWEAEKAPPDEIEEDVLKSIKLLEYGEALPQEEIDRCRLIDKKRSWEAEQ